MIHKMKNYEVLSPSIVPDRDGEEVQNLAAAGSVSMFISLSSGNTNLQNNVKTVNASHIGITPSKQLKEGFIILSGDERYKVDYVNNAPKLSVIYLIEVASYGE